METAQQWGYPELHKSHYFNNHFNILPSTISCFKCSAFFTSSYQNSKCISITSHTFYMPFHTMLDIISTTALVPNHDKDVCMYTNTHTYTSTITMVVQDTNFSVKSRCRWKVGSSCHSVHVLLSHRLFSKTETSHCTYNCFSYSY